jgi:uncharacterized protein (TIGR04255 family)
VMSGIGNWRPTQGTHAIQMAAVGVNFRDPLTSLLLENAEGSVPITVRELCQRNELKELGFLIGPGGQPQPQVQTAGAEFTRHTSPDSLSNKFVLSKNSMRYEEYEYTRWANLSQQIEIFFSNTYDIFAHATYVNSVYVEYVDVFVCPTEYNDSVNFVIDPKSQYVASGANSDEGLWHTHSGFFESNAGEIRRLHQINIDVSNAHMPDGLMRAIQVRTFVSDNLSESPEGNQKALTLSWVQIATRLSELHKATKEDFGQVLTPDAAIAISLG